MFASAKRDPADLVLVQTAIIPHEEVVAGMTTISTKLKGEWEIIPFGISFLQSLIISWFIILFLEVYGVPSSLRLLLGAGILFLFLLPVFLVFEGFHYTTPTVGFFVPLVLYTLVFPLFDSLFFDLNRFLDPWVIIPSIIGGIGFGLIGVGSYHMKKSSLNAFIWATIGTTLIFLSSPDILQAFLYVVSGDPSFVGKFITI
jgi:hypothetical protein